MDQRIPELTVPLFEDYLLLASQQLAGLVVAFYVEGSIALGEFNERFSDVDFVAILGREATRAEVDALGHIHDTIRKRYPRWMMMGSYLQLDDLDRSDDRIELRPACHDGVVRLDGHFELDSVEGWILKNHGIALTGPEPRDLPFTVDWDLIIAKMSANLNTYWASWTRRPDRMVMILSDWGVQWTVLGVLRQFYSFREDSITTKIKAGEYGLACLPARWHRLIREAINVRQGVKSSLYRSRTWRAVHAVRFVKYIIRSCNEGGASCLDHAADSCPEAGG